MQQEIKFQIKKKTVEQRAYMLPPAGPDKRLQNQQISLRQSPTEASQTKTKHQVALAIDRNVWAQKVRLKEKCQ